MKTVEIAKAIASLAAYAKDVRKEPIIVTVKEKPTAALLAIENEDVETVTQHRPPVYRAHYAVTRSSEDRRGNVQRGDSPSTRAEKEE